MRGSEAAGGRLIWLFFPRIFQNKYLGIPKQVKWNSKTNPMLNSINKYFENLKTNTPEFKNKSYGIPKQILWGIPSEIQIQECERLKGGSLL